MNVDNILYDILLLSGLILFIMGIFFFFFSSLMVKWNAFGNKWLGSENYESKHLFLKRILLANYILFANHRITGGIMWGLSSLFLIIYTFYHS